MTLRAHGKAWNEFSRWCQARGLKPLPAHAWTVAAYLRWCEPRNDLTAIRDIIKAVARRHLLAGHKDPERDPLVKRTLAMIKRRMESRHHHSDLFDEEPFKEAGRENRPDVRDEPEERPRSRPAERVVRTMRSAPKLVSRRPR